MATKRAKWQEWARRVAAWRRSGESATTFAERHGWNPHTLRWWASRGLRTKQATSLDVPFVEVSVAAPPTRHAGVIDIVLRNGRRLRVRGGVDAEAISALARALEA